MEYGLRINTMHGAYRSSIRVKQGDSFGAKGQPILDIEVNYTTVATKTDEESCRTSFQHRISKREGRRIPRHEIVVHPAAGEPCEVMSFFLVHPKKSLPLEVYRIKQKAPYALAYLIEELRMAKASYAAGTREDRLFEHAIDGLVKLVSD